MHLQSGTGQPGCRGVGAREGGGGDGAGAVEQQQSSLGMGSFNLTSALQAVRRAFLEHPVRERPLAPANGRLGALGVERAVLHRRGSTASWVFGGPLTVQRS